MLTGLDGFDRCKCAAGEDGFLAGVMDKKALWNEGNVSKSTRTEEKEREHRREFDAAKEDEWNEREAELSKQNTAFIKDHEAVKDILSASEIKSLFNKINRIAIPFATVGAGGIEPHDIDPTKKLFYIVDGVNELLDQITLLSNAKEELRSTLSRQALEVERLKLK